MGMHWKLTLEVSSWGQGSIYGYQDPELKFDYVPK